MACTVGVAQLAYENAPAAVAKLSLETNQLDYGTIEQNSDGTRTISFTNGDAPLIISEVKSSCGCTIPSYSKEPVLPNEQGRLRLSTIRRNWVHLKTITIFQIRKKPPIV